MGIIEALCNVLVIFSIHWTKQLGSQSVKLIRNCSAIEFFNSFVNFLHLKLILEPYKTECWYFYCLRFLLLWTVYSLFFITNIISLDRYIHVRYMNDYATVFTPLRFNAVFVINMAGSFYQSVASTAIVVIEGPFKAMKLTLPLNVVIPLCIIYLNIKSIFLLKRHNQTMNNTISFSGRSIIKISALYFNFYVATITTVLTHHILTKWTGLVAGVDPSTLSFHRIFPYCVMPFCRIVNKLPFLWINQDCRALLKSCFNRLFRKNRVSVVNQINIMSRSSKNSDFLG